MKRIVCLLLFAFSLYASPVFSQEDDADEELKKPSLKSVVINVYDEKSQAFITKLRIYKVGKNKYEYEWTPNNATKTGVASVRVQEADPNGGPVTILDLSPVTGTSGGIFYINRTIYPLTVSRFIELATNKLTISIFDPGSIPCYGYVDRATIKFEEEN